MKHIYLRDLNLAEKDFKFEFVELTDPTYNALNGFSPKRDAIVKINGNLIQFKTCINFELLSDIRAHTGFNTEESGNKILKSEAIDFYINNNQYLRKKKLEKLNEISKRSRFFGF